MLGAHFLTATKAEKNIYSEIFPRWFPVPSSWLHCWLPAWFRVGRKVETLYSRYQPKEPGCFNAPLVSRKRPHCVSNIEIYVTGRQTKYIRPPFTKALKVIDKLYKFENKTYNVTIHVHNYSKAGTKKEDKCYPATKKVKYETFEDCPKSSVAELSQNDGIQPQSATTMTDETTTTTTTSQKKPHQLNQ